MVDIDSLLSRLDFVSDNLVLFVYRDDTGAWRLTNFMPIATLGEIWFGYSDLVNQLNKYKNGTSDLLKDVDVVSIKRLFGVK